MKLSEALVELKNLKSRASKLNELVKTSVVHYEDEVPEFAYVDVAKERLDLLGKINVLKGQIQRTNVLTYSDAGENLARLILANSTIRSELAFLNLLLDTDISYGGKWTGGDRTKDTIKKQYATGFTKQGTRLQIKELEDAKKAVEGKIAYLNVVTNLLAEESAEIIG